MMHCTTKKPTIIITYSQSKEAMAYDAHQCNQTLNNKKKKKSSYIIFFKEAFILILIYIYNLYFHFTYIFIPLSYKMCIFITFTHFFFDFHLICT